MRIGIDCRTMLNTQSGEVAGIAHYSHFLVKHILDIDQKNSYTLFFSSHQDIPRELIRPNVTIVRFAKKFVLYFDQHVRSAQIIQKQRLDLFHSLSGILPLHYRGTSIVTVADLSMYVRPEWFSPWGIIGDFFWRKILIPKSIQKAKTIIAISRNTKKDLIRFFGINEKKIRVIYLGCELEDVGDAGGQDIIKQLGLENKKYFLFVGTLEPRKNIVRIIQAFDDFFLKNPGSGMRLVIAGKPGWKYGNIFKKIEQSPNAKSIHCLGYINAKQKTVLYKHAAGLIWPSLYEGFGLPVLEAMTAGVPVITSNTSSLPEVGCDAVLYVNPENVGEIHEAMEKLVFGNDLCERLRQKGFEQARRFSWEKAARETVYEYEKLFSERIL